MRMVFHGSLHACREYAHKQGATYDIDRTCFTRPSGVDCKVFVRTEGRKWWQFWVKRFTRYPDLLILPDA